MPSEHTPSLNSFEVLKLMNAVAAQVGVQRYRENHRHLLRTGEIIDIFSER